MIIAGNVIAEQASGDPAACAPWLSWGRNRLALFIQLYGAGPWTCNESPVPGVTVQLTMHGGGAGLIRVQAEAGVEGLVLSVPHRMAALDPETGRHLKFMRLCALARDSFGAATGYKPEASVPPSVPAKYGYAVPKLGVWPGSDEAPLFWDFYAGAAHPAWTGEEMAYWSDLANTWDDDLGVSWGTREHFEFRKRYRQFVSGKEHYHVSYSFMGYSIDPGGPLPVAETFMDDYDDVTFGLSFPWSIHGRDRYYEFPKRAVQAGGLDFLSNGVYVNGRLYSFPGGYPVLAARVVTETVDGAARRVLAMVGWAGVVSGATTVYLYRVPLRRGWQGWNPVAPTAGQRWAATIGGLERTGFNVGDPSTNSAALIDTDSDRWNNALPDWDTDDNAWDLPAEWPPRPYSPWDISEDGWRAAGVVSSIGNTAFFEGTGQRGGPATGYGMLATWTVECDFSAGTSTVAPGWDTGYLVTDPAGSYSTTQKVAAYYDGATLKHWSVEYSGNALLTGLTTSGGDVHGFHRICKAGYVPAGASESYTVRLLKDATEFCVLRQSTGPDNMSQVIPLRIGCDDNVDVVVEQSFVGGTLDGAFGAVVSPTTLVNTFKVKRDGADMLSEAVPVHTNLEWADWRLANGELTAGQYAALIADPGFDPAGVRYVAPTPFSLGVPAYSPAEIWVARDKRIASQPTLVSLGATMLQAQAPDYRYSVWASPKFHRIAAHGLTVSTLVPSATEAQDDTLYPLGLV